MENSATFNKARKIVGEQLGCDHEEVVESAKFTEDLGADSLDTVELIMTFEEEFGIEIPDADAQRIKTFREAVDYIDSRLAAKQR